MVICYWNGFYEIRRLSCPCLFAITFIKKCKMFPIIFVLVAALSDLPKPCKIKVPRTDLYPSEILVHQAVHSMTWWKFLNRQYNIVFNDFHNFILFCVLQYVYSSNVLYNLYNFFHRISFLFEYILYVYRLKSLWIIPAGI